MNIDGLGKYSINDLRAKLFSQGYDVTKRDPSIPSCRVKEIAKQDVIVSGILLRGGSTEDCVEALSNQNRILTDKLIELQGTAPFRIQEKDGRILTWRCPNNLIPIRETYLTEPGKEENKTKEKDYVEEEESNVEG